MQDREREHGQSCKGYYVDAPMFYYFPGAEGVRGFLREVWGGQGEETWRATIWEYLNSFFARREKVGMEDRERQGVGQESGHGN